MPAVDFADVWLAEEVDLPRRPVLVVTRRSALPLLRRVTVVPITRRVRGIPTELELGQNDGLREDCVAAFDNIRQLPKALLLHRIANVDHRRLDICSTLAALADC